MKVTHSLLMLHPLVAFVVVMGIWLSLSQLMLMGPTEMTFSLATAAFAFLILGYLVWVALGLAALMPERVQVKRLRLLGVFTFAVVFAFFGLRVMQMLVEGNPMERSAMAILWILAAAAPIYVCAVGSRSLVKAEHVGQPGWARSFGTFILFYLLPLGIIFIQMRLRRLFPAAPPAAPYDKSLTA